MTKRGGSTRLKRLAAPITYKVPRKHFKWVVRTVPGPHPMDMSIPLAVLLRDVLGVARNMREVKYMLRKGYVKIDGKYVREYRFPIGLMDVVELVPTKEFYRILPGTTSPLAPYKIEKKKESSLKPLLIKNKVMVKGGNLQFTTHDGRNFLFTPKDKKSVLKPGDVFIYDFKSKKIRDVIRFEPGVYALVYWGSKRGVVGKITEVRKVHPLKPKVVSLEVDGEVIETIFKYVFPIGKEAPVISVGGVGNE
jgi:small subunit ribosomal protein S4e